MSMPADDSACATCADGSRARLDGARSSTTASAARRRAAALELAASIHPRSSADAAAHRRRAVHLQDAGRHDLALDAWLAAADAHLASGSASSAVSALVLAAASNAPAHVRSRHLERAAHLAFHEGVDGAHELWLRVMRLAAAGASDEDYARALFHLAWSAPGAPDVDRLRRAAAFDPERSGWAARSQACLLLVEGRHTEAAAFDERALEAATAGDDRWLEAVALEKLAVSRSHVGELDAAVAHMRSAIAIASSLGAHRWAVTGALSLVDMLLEQLATAEAVELARTTTEYARDRRMSRFLPVCESYHAFCLARAGDLPGAVERSVSAMSRAERDDADPYWFAVANIHAEILAETGAGVAAEQALALAQRAAETIGYGSFSFEVAFTDARLAALRHDPDAAELAGAVLAVEEAGSMATVARWMAQLAARSGASSALEHACSLVARIGADGAHVSATVALCTADVTATAQAVRTGDCADLERVADRWAAAGRPLDAARARAVAGELLASSGPEALPDAVVLLEQALTELVACGAHGDARHVVHQLRLLGVQRRITHQGSGGSLGGVLAPREAEFAQLVADGLDMATVAERMYLTRNSVKKVAASAYRKTETHNRVQLAAWVHAQLEQELLTPC